MLDLVLIIYTYMYSMHKAAKNMHKNTEPANNLTEYLNLALYINTKIVLKMMVSVLQKYKIQLFL